MTQPSPRTTRGRRAHRSMFLAAGLAGALLVLGACSSGGDDSGSAVGPSSADAVDGTEAGSGGGAAAERAADSATQPRAPQAGVVDVAQTQVRTRAVISTGMVSVYADDVADARFDVQEIVDGAGGVIGDEQTQTGPTGAVTRSRLVLRVPAASFDETLGQLEKVGALKTSKRSSEDVTTQVIDVEVRIRAQEQSLRRIELLLDRAQSIKDIVGIEAQLTRRQADLDSLKQQQAWLADQTSESTITVLIEKTPQEGPPPSEDPNPFWAGLTAGWTSLLSVGSTVAAVAGWLIPFALALGLVGLPLGWLVRRMLRGRSLPAPTPAGGAEG